MDCQEILKQIEFNFDEIKWGNAYGAVWFSSFGIGKSAISDEPFVTFSFPSMSSLLVWLYLDCDRWIGNMLKDFLGAFRNCLHSLTSLQRNSDMLESKCILKKYKDDYLS
jgi:hypothetical protein